MEIIHYGIKRRSGRYPWGSGERPFQSVSAMKKKSVDKKRELAKTVLGMDISKTQAARGRRDMSGLELKKGDRVQHITGVGFPNIRNSQLYVTATESDNSLYEAFLSMNLKSKGYKPSKVILELKEDLKVPSSKDQKIMFFEILKDNKGLILSDLNNWLSSKNKDPLDLKDVKNDDELYDLFMNSIERPSESQKIFYNKLKENGFNGVRDEHDVTGSWMQGQKPIVIMDALNTVGNVKISDITNADMVEALEKWINSK